MLSIFLIALLVTTSAGFELFPSYEEAKWTLVEGQQPEDKSASYRRYLPAKWASTNVTGVDFDEAGEEAFRRILKYFNGRNSENLCMKMTIPVTTMFVSRPCPFCNMTYTMSFYIPMLHQTTPPQPTDPLVDVHTIPETHYYVRQFSGRAKANDWRSEASKLYTTLLQCEVTGVSKTGLLAAGYDGPWTFFNRRNEVWLWVENDPTASW